MRKNCIARVVYFKVPLAAQGKPLREISDLLTLSRYTVRRILRGSERPVESTAPGDRVRRKPLEPVFERARGNVVRVQEMLAA